MLLRIMSAWDKVKENLAGTEGISYKKGGVLVGLGC